MNFELEYPPAEPEDTLLHGCTLFGALYQISTTKPSEGFAEDRFKPALPNCSKHRF
jgi:hypothetical protein